MVLWLALYATAAIAIAILMQRLRTRIAPRVYQAPVDRLNATVEDLHRVFGAENVKAATNLKLRVITTSTSAPLKLGGAPDFLVTEQWPACRTCKLPMTFIAQLPVGPEALIRYPVIGRLFVFLCNSKAAKCETWAPTSGGSSVFVQPNGQPSLPVPVPHPTMLLSKEYAVDTQVLPSVRVPKRANAEQDRYSAAVHMRFQVQVGGFADWVQEPIEINCSCGSPTELLMQFETFDEVIRLGEAGRAYVFGCKARHAPDAFFLEWQSV